VSSSDVRGRAGRPEHQAVVRLLDVEETVQAWLDVHGEPVDPELAIARLGLFHQHGLHPSPHAGQPDPGVGVKTPGGLVRLRQDLPGPVGDLDHPLRLAQAPVHSFSVLAEGTTAPSFTLPDQHGNPVALEDLRGRWVVLWWFVRADTPG
jgi:hypothetical protein